MMNDLFGAAELQLLESATMDFLPAKDQELLEDLDPGTLKALDAMFSSMFPKRKRRRYVRVKPKPSNNLYERDRARRQRERYSDEAYGLSLMCDITPSDPRIAQQICSASRGTLRELRRYREQVERVRPYLDQQTLDILT